MSTLFHDEGPPATGQKVMLATPSYGSPDAAYTFSIANSRQALSAAGIQSAYLLLEGNCHVDDARNSIVRHFLESDCTELLFLDADVKWEPDVIVRLCKRDLDVVGAVYPYRREGSVEIPVRLKDGARPIDGLLEVDGLPTGFMKIKRHVLEQMAADAPQYFDKVFETALVFDRPTPGEDKTRWGGDVDFCNRWKARGGKLYADQELRLGHVAKIVISDSLGAHLRRMSGTTLADLIPKFRDESENPQTDYDEIFKYAGNNYAADPGGLAMVTMIARKCRGPIIETGSGMSSILMASVTDQKVYSLEHMERYAIQTHSWALEAGINGNLGICSAPLKDFWYDLSKFDLPNKFAFGFCDGPPRLYGSRMRFFDEIAPRCTVIAVDDVTQDHNYLQKVHEWANANNRSVEILGRAALLKKKAA